MFELQLDNSHFEQALKQIFAECLSDEAKGSPTTVAAEYALFGGGKRFRPQLCYAAGESLKLKNEWIDPIAAAIEFIHTYSLIHDDLPCMDDDDVRRVRPTVHKKFGEATALLAGDLLLTEAFGVLARGYKNNPRVAIELVSLLTGRAGGSGMILGQVFDLDFAVNGGNLDQLHRIHRLKTGDLISCCLEGLAVVAEVSPEKRQKMAELGSRLGLAFQIKDDLLDGEDGEQQNFISFIGQAKTESLLEQVTADCYRLLDEAQLVNSRIKELVEFNFKRNK